MSKHYSNEYLFSEIYLNEITQIEEDPDVVAYLETIKDYREYADTSDIDSWNNSYISEILQSLGFQLEHKNDNLILLKPFGETNNILTICYSVIPEENLDKNKMDEHWAEKIIRNLRDNDLHWGILTNGKKWRVYHTEESVPYDNFLEIDLEEILNEEDTSSYQIFHHFMQAKNFKTDEDDKCKFDIFKKESQEKIEYIEDELKDALKQKEEKEGAKGILSSLCMGYKAFLQKNGDPDFNNEELRDTIYGSAMLYMFRLLFLFYGKARDLLKQEDQQRFEKILSYAIDNKDSKTLEEDTYIWRELSYIFGEIDIYYDGGLFNPRENKLTAFIEEHKISDYYLIDVLYYLYYYEKDGEMVPISYRDMNVRHLGTLYEGLLEHKLYIAEEDTEIKITNKKIEFIPKSEGGKIVKGSYIPEGKVYFAGDKKERKKIGAYYTPEYIVEYIVANTVGEKVDELIEQFKEDISSTIESLNSSISKDEKDNYKDYIHDQIIKFINEEILELSVLDPAMGSGHFLVNATNLITNKIVEFLNDFGLNLDIDTSPQYWRRKVVENCIYGVDKNELAVNLAKLSLWILSMAKDKPLSFLDHHLKRGDSLVGAKLENVGQFPRDKRIKGVNLFKDNHFFEQDVQKIVEQYKNIEKIESEERDIIDSKKEILEKIKEKIKPYKFICDFHTQATYDERISQDKYESVISDFDTDFTYEYPNNFFHWELEYPEVLIENEGFDCIVGNPPYVQIQKFKGEIYQKILENQQYDSFSKTADLYCLFYENGAKILNSNGIFAMITSNKWLRSKYGKKLRSYLAQTVSPIELVNFVGHQVFKTVSIDTCILRFTKIDTQNVPNGIKVSNNFTNSIYDYIKNNRLCLEVNTRAPWIIGSHDELNIREKIERIGTPLKDLEININRGLITGCNEAFIINEDKRQELINSDPKNREIIKPILKGKNIKRYYINSNTKWLILAHNGYTNKQNQSINRVNIKDDYPIIKEHLDEYWKQIKNRYDQGYTPYNLRSCNYLEEFKREKVVWGNISDINSFCYANANKFINAPANLLTSSDDNIKFLLAVMNSNIFFWEFKDIGIDLGKAFEWKKQYVEKIHIPKANRLKQKQFEPIVDKILLQKKKNPNSDTTSYERRIDKMIYNLYDLKNKEIDLIEKSVNNILYN